MATIAANGSGGVQLPYSAAASQFDPVYVRAFTDFIQREFWRHDDFDAYLAESADEHEYVRVRARMDAMIAGGRPNGS